MFLPCITDSLHSRYPKFSTLWNSIYSLSFIFFFCVHCAIRVDWKFSGCFRITLFQIPYFADGFSLTLLKVVLFMLKIITFCISKHCSVELDYTVSLRFACLYCYSVMLYSVVFLVVSLYHLNGLMFLVGKLRDFGLRVECCLCIVNVN